MSKIAVAMSGGVDSAVVAAMLHRQGLDCVGMTMQLWNQRRLPELSTGDGAGRCCSLDDVYDARAVAGRIGIPYYVVNFEDRFEQHVVKPFIDEYLAGRTPVPCTLCNNFIKFDQFLEMADAVGADVIATGHYARIVYDDAADRWQLRRSTDENKDQTYFLFGLTQEQLQRTMFPLGGLTKPEVRALAEELDLPVAEKPDSQEICFVPNGDYAAFIDAYFREQGVRPGHTQGELVSTGGKVLGQHHGVHHFTIGQRKGIEIARRKPEKLYVIETDPATRRVTVGANEELMRSEFRVQDVNWISIAPPEAPVTCEVRIRNRHRAAEAVVERDGTGARVRFVNAQRAVTPGQGAVFYQGDLVLGGGWIE